MHAPNRPARARRPDPARFIRRHTRLVPVPSVPEISLHLAHEATGLWRLTGTEAGGDAARPPYWAFPWAGGMALARFLLDRPGLVAGRRVLDLGAGSGLVAIAAAKAGASKVTASEIDEYALAAIRLNAEANGVAFGIVGDLLGGAPPVIDLVAAGDLFYEAGLAERVLRFLDLCIEGGAEVLIGDPGRNHLPRGRLEFIADYRVPDVGEVERGTNQASAVFRLTPPRRRRAG